MEKEEKTERIISSDSHTVSRKIAVDDCHLAMSSLNGSYSMEAFGFTREELNDIFSRFITSDYDEKLSLNDVFTGGDMPVIYENGEVPEKGYKLSTAMETGILKTNFMTLAGMNADYILKQVNDMFSGIKMPDGTFLELEPDKKALDTLNLLCLNVLREKITDYQNEEEEYMRKYVNKMDIDIPVDGAKDMNYTF